MTLSNEDVEEILRLVDQLEVDEFELTTDRYHLRLRRSPGEGWTASTRVTAEPTELSPPVEDEDDEASDGDGSADAVAAAPERDGLLEVRAPLLGTFYRAPRPGAEPYVETGDHVDEDTVVGIIETMKLMNSVHAGVRGTVVDIRKANAEFAEAGDVLMFVEPDPS